MILSDKGTLRRCVKQSMRRHAAVDADLRCSLTEDDLGIRPLLGTIPGGMRLLEGSTEVPGVLTEDAQAVYAALDALGLSSIDLKLAEEQQKGYARSVWLREILEGMPCSAVLCEVGMNRKAWPADMDTRYIPLLMVYAEQVEFGRYGVNLQEEAERIFAASAFYGTRHIGLRGYREEFLRYCLLPLAEDRNLILHLWLESRKELEHFIQLFHLFPSVRCVLHAFPEDEPALIREVQGSMRILPVIASPENFPAALSQLGLRFLPFSSEAGLPEQMLGRWQIRRERLSDALAEHYLPLARSGRELTSEAVDADIEELLSRNFLHFSQMENLQ